MPHTVYNDSCHKFHGNYKNIASQDLFPQWFIPSNLAALQINKQETDSTKQKHAPVRKSTKQLFKYRLPPIPMRQRYFPVLPIKTPSLSFLPDSLSVFVSLYRWKILQMILFCKFSQIIESFTFCQVCIDIASDHGGLSF